MKFKTVGIVGRQDLPKMGETLAALVHFLERLKRNIILSEKTVPQFNQTTWPVMSLVDLSKEADLIIVVGGDGSLLSTARTVAQHDTPVLGINLGCLGFLTDVCADEIEKKIGEILMGNFTQEDRFLLEARTDSAQGIALNEVVLSPGKTPHMIEFEIYTNNQFMYSQRSDGMIIATPTGSTAYALSAGGPIIHPAINAIVLIPMFPHSLTNRPILLDGDSKIKIVLSANTTIPPRLICDSQTCLEVNRDSNIIIQKMPKPLHLIHPLDYNYFEALYSKLHWSRKLPCFEK